MSPLAVIGVWILVAGLSAMLLRCDPCTRNVADGYMCLLVGSQVLADAARLMIAWPLAGWIGVGVQVAGVVASLVFVGYAFRWHGRWHGPPPELPPRWLAG